MVSLYPGQKANEIANNATQRYENKLKELKNKEKETDNLAQKYGEFQFDIIKNTIGRFRNFLEKIDRKASESEKEILEGINIEVQELKLYEKQAIKAEQYLTAGVKSAGAAAAGYTGAITVATSIGAASTGTAISSLSGAAAWNATLAWFGGGAIAAGGGGMALGTLVLGGITVVPALAIGGFFAVSEGNKAITKAYEYNTKVNKAIKDMEEAREIAKQIQNRIRELETILKCINNKTLNSLNELESQSFDIERDTKKFQEVGLLIRAIIDIIKIRILNDKGKLNNESTTIMIKYRQLAGN